MAQDGATQQSTVMDASSALLAESGARDSAVPPPSEAGTDATPVDVAHSKACTDYCAKASKCGTCDPSADCAPPAGSCDKAQVAYLQCEADTGQFVCGTDGWAVLSSCHRDNSVCPASQPIDAGAACSTTPPDMACVRCLKTNCSKLYDTLMSNPELQDFSGCVADCEKACFPAATCPAQCSGSLSAYYDYMNLQICGNIACYHDRADVGPNLCKPTTIFF
jgi:hypothetical protein